MKLKVKGVSGRTSYTRKRIQVMVPEPLYDGLKILAAMEEVPLSEYCRDIFKEFVRKEYPNRC